MENINPKARILIVDDHPVVRQGVAQFLNGEPDLEVCGEADDFRTAMDAIAALKPDLAIVDIAMPRIDGIELIKKAVGEWPELPILVLSMHDKAVYAERSLRAGAKGYVMKQDATEELPHAVRKVLGGQIYKS